MEKLRIWDAHSLCEWMSLISEQARFCGVHFTFHVHCYF